MKDTLKSLSISVLVHGLLIGAVLATWVNKPIQTRTVLLDFSMLNFESRGERAGVLTGDSHAGQYGPVKETTRVEGLNVAQVDKNARGAEFAVNLPPISPPASLGSPGMPSDKDGQVEVSGREGSFAGQGEPGKGTSLPARTGQLPGAGDYGGGSDGQTIRYGSGSANERTFHYIREGILKNVRYPEKARRKGHTGKILLSFTVTEGGVTRDVKVVNGSGFTELDNSAKEAVRQTTFSQKIPHNLYVILPIEYRLE